VVGVTTSVFTDDKTRLTYLRLLHQKSKACTAYKGFEAWFHIQHDTRLKLKVLHSDRANEYLGKEFVIHLKSTGTEHNGVAQRLNRTLLEKVYAMLYERLCYVQRRKGPAINVKHPGETCGFSDGPYPNPWRPIPDHSAS
jgi:hypothetical protein